jgi:hypothetical protein
MKNKCDEDRGCGRFFGHIPPQTQVINGAIDKVKFADSKATVWQNLKE